MNNNNNIYNELLNNDFTNIKHNEYNYFFTYKNKNYQLNIFKSGYFSIYYECLCLASKCNLEKAISIIKKHALK